MNQSIICHVCNKQFSRRFSLKRHLNESSCRPTVTTLKECSICSICKGVAFGQFPDSMENKEFVCQICDKGISNFNRHVKNVHMRTEDQKSHKLGILCPFENCEERFPREAHLSEHLKEHGIEVDVQHLEFKNESDFLEWKNDMEYKTSSQYIKISGTKTYGGLKKTYLKCHRSGQRVIKVTNRKRALKSQGSNKIGKTCPSKIEIIQDEDSTFFVRFWSKHFGHTNDLSRLKLDKPSKDKIARKLQDGVTFENILDDIKEKKVDISKRSMLIERKDLHNIVRDYNLSYDAKRHAIKHRATKRVKEASVLDSVPSAFTSANENNELSTLFVQSEVEIHTSNNVRLANKAKLLSDMLSSNISLSASDAQVIEQGLDSLLTLLNKTSDDGPSNKFDSNEVSVPEKIEQVRFSSTKKKIKRLERLKEPSWSVSKNISEGFKCDSQTFLNVHAASDHTYTRRARNYC